MPSHPLPHTMPSHPHPHTMPSHPLPHIMPSHSLPHIKDVLLHWTYSTAALLIMEHNISGRCVHYTHTHAHTHTDIHTHACTHMHTHTYTQHTHTHTCTHIHAHTITPHTYTYTHSTPSQLSPVLSHPPGLLGAFAALFFLGVSLEGLRALQGHLLSLSMRGTSSVHTTATSTRER